MNHSIKKIISHTYKHHRISIDEWANTLTYHEYNQFKQAQNKNNKLKKQYVENGLITILPIIKSMEKTTFSFDLRINVSRTFDIKIGEEIIFSPGVTIDQVPDDPDYYLWEQRFNKEYKKLLFQKVKYNQ